MSTMRKKGFVLVAGVMQQGFVEDICGNLDPSEVLLIYSSWDGYYKAPELVKENPQYKVFRNAFHNVVDIHTSGHADRKTIKEVIETVKPKEVICIHKEADASLKSLDISEEINYKINNQIIKDL
jgi:ribonuclease J